MHGLLLAIRLHTERDTNHVWSREIPTMFDLREIPTMFDVRLVVSLMALLHRTKYTKQRVPSELKYHEARSVHLLCLGALYPPVASLGAIYGVNHHDAILIYNQYARYQFFCWVDRWFLLMGDSCLLVYKLRRLEPTWTDNPWITGLVLYKLSF